MPYKENMKYRATVYCLGKRYTSVLATKEEAKNWEAEKKKELKKFSKTRKPGMALATLCTRYLDEAVKFSPKTYQEKESLARRIQKFFGPEYPVAYITPEMILSYLNKRASLGDRRGKKNKLQNTNSSFNRDRKNLMAMWNWGIGILDQLQECSNPLLKIEARPHERSTQYVPSTTDVSKMLAAATEEERVFLKCYLHTAARRSDIFRWKWAEDVSLERRMVRLGSRKNKDRSMQYDWLPMSDDLYDALAWWWTNRPVKDAAHVFVVTDPLHPNYGKPFTQRRRILKSICKRADVQPVTYHCLRRYVASLLADKYKVSAKTIQSFLRQNNLYTTEKYIYQLNSDLKRIVNLLSETNLHEDLHEREI